MLNINCKDCIYSSVQRFDKNWKVATWYCCKNFKLIPANRNIDCTDFIHYAEDPNDNLHDDDTAPGNA